MKRESYFLVSKRSQLELWCCELVFLNELLFQSIKHIMFQEERELIWRMLSTSSSKGISISAGSSGMVAPLVTIPAGPPITWLEVHEVN